MSARVVSNTSAAALGARLRTLRIVRCLTLRTVAERIGVAVSYLSDVERGRRGVSMDRLADLAEALGVQAKALVKAAGLCGHCHGTGIKR